MLPRLLLNDLPPEILCRIFTLGSEVPDVRSPRWKRGYIEEGFPAGYSYTRRLKSFVAIASSVCSLWHSLVHVKANYHFWVTGLYLRTLTAEPHLHMDIGPQLLDFKRNLDSSHDSDLNFYLHIYGDTQCLDISSPELAIALRLLLHGV